MNEPVLKEICLRNILSFGPDTEPLHLGPLNVLIGPNGSGKSNLIEAINLLRATPHDVSEPINRAGGVREWLWKGAKNPTASIEVILKSPDTPDTMRPTIPIRHCFSFEEIGNRFELLTEQIEDQERYRDFDKPVLYYKNDHYSIQLKETLIDGDYIEEEDRILGKGVINPDRSVLAQVKDPERLPILAYLTEVYNGIHLYREWSFGRLIPLRQAQKPDLPSKYLMETCRNLPLVLSELRPKVKRKIIKELNQLLPGIEDYYISITGGLIQLNLDEENFSTPAARLSDGTLRYLCLLAILCHPEPPPLVCIEEPELGLHPDVIPRLAKLMIEASERCQLIVTTHSEMLVNALTDTPESVIVCEKRDGSTKMQRLNSQDLTEWLKKYRLGELWLKGEIGGTRW